MNTPKRRNEAGAATRGLAALAVESVLAQGVTLDDALAGLPLGELSGSDRGQVRALAFGALRSHHRHRLLLGQLLVQGLAKTDSLLEALLSIGIFQLLDEMQPDYAAISASVEATRWLGRPRAVGLVNATLRRLQRERDALLAYAMQTPEGRYSHPDWLIQRLQHDWPEQWTRILDAAQKPPPLWLRINRSRTDFAAYAGRLAEAGLVGAPLEGVSEAVRLSPPMPVNEIPGFDAGCVSVQDPASQLAARFLSPTPGERVLDACAAPGGKTTHLLELVDGALDLTALDIDSDRLSRVGENLQRLGFVATTVHGDAARSSDWWDGRLFDAILVDAPCSATGIIRRHPDIKFLRRESDIPALAQWQLHLLEQLWPLLRAGGRLLYSTCSILSEENTAVVTAFLARHPDASLAAPATDLLPPWVRQQNAGGWQVLPGSADTDGFYYALMTRNAAAPGAFR